MTSPTPTEGIEPTIRRIAEDVCREYLGSILGLCLGKQKAPQEPAPVEESEAVRKAREEERAKVNAEWQTGSGYQSPEAILEMHGRAVDRAVHQARVDALATAACKARAFAQNGPPGPAGEPLGYRNACLALALEFDAEADRLESEQAKTAEPARLDPDGTSVPKTSIHARASVSGYGIVQPDAVPFEWREGEARVPLAPAEAKVAPEQMPTREARMPDGSILEYTYDMVMKASDALGILIVNANKAVAMSDETPWTDINKNERAAQVIRDALSVRADIVERRVAEAGKAARIQAALTTRHVLQAAGDEDTQDAARRVVAERDAAEVKAKANYDEGMKHYLRAEAAEARVRELASRLEREHAEWTRASERVTELEKVVTRANDRHAEDQAKIRNLEAEHDALLRERALDVDMATKPLVERIRELEAWNLAGRDMTEIGQMIEASRKEARAAESELARVRAELAEARTETRRARDIELEECREVLRRYRDALKENGQVSNDVIVAADTALRRLDEPIIRQSIRAAKVKP